MDILINAPGHNKQETVKEYYTQKINEKYGMYPYITKAVLKIIETDNDCIECNLTMQLKGHKTLFASSTEEKEVQAFTKTLKKLNQQLEKYKEVKYARN